MTENQEFSLEDFKSIASLIEKPKNTICIKCILVRMFNFRREKYGISICPTCRYWEKRPEHKQCAACELFERDGSLKNAVENKK